MKSLGSLFVMLISLLAAAAAHAGLPDAELSTDGIRTVSTQLPIELPTAEKAEKPGEPVPWYRVQGAPNRSLGLVFAGLALTAAIACIIFGPPVKEVRVAAGVGMVGAGALAAVMFYG